MHRIVTTLAVLLISTAALAADAQRYIVATKHSLRDSAPGTLRRAIDADFEPRAAAVFKQFSGFAAELTESELATLRQSPGVRWVEPVLERYALDTRNLKGQTTPLGIQILRAPNVWPGRRSGDVNVVVIDTGVDWNHPDLKSVWAGGHNVFDGGDVPRDDNGHGTHVAGTIAALDNDIGVVGVAPHNVRLWGIKVLNARGTGTTEGIMKAVEWVIARKKELGGNWVLNLSLGAKEQSQAEREVFQRAADDGIIVVAAAGNDSRPDAPAPVMFPAAYPSVVAVGAMNGRTAIATFSGQGPELDVAAPGVDVLSTMPVGSNHLSYVIDGPNRYFTVPLIGSKLGEVSGEYVYCGLGAEDDFPETVAGRIALIKRGGDIPFAEKTRRAMKAGAIAVVIFNHDLSGRNWTLIIESDPTTAMTEWPVTLAMTLEDGEALAKRGSGSVTLAYASDDYGESTGTSMASPHVAGAAALLWTLAPNATAKTVLNALTTTAVDHGEPGRDPIFGDGAIDVAAAAWFLAPEAFHEVSYQRPTTGRRSLRRGGK